MAVHRAVCRRRRGRGRGGGAVVFDFLEIRQHRQRLCRRLVGGGDAAHQRRRLKRSGPRTRWSSGRRAGDDRSAGRQAGGRPGRRRLRPRGAQSARLFRQPGGAPGRLRASQARLRTARQAWQFRRSFRRRAVGGEKQFRIGCGGARRGESVDQRRRRHDPSGGAGGEDGARHRQAQSRSHRDPRADRRRGGATSGRRSASASRPGRR